MQEKRNLLGDGPYMTKRRQINEIPYSAEMMFGLVSDVEQYPEFVPFCNGLRILNRGVEDGHETLLAEMLDQYKVFRERFKCKVTLVPEENLITVKYAEGPIKKLENVWRFRNLENKDSEIDFEIEFEFKSYLLQQMSNSVFDKVFLRMSDAFIERAHQLYGPSDMSS